MSKETVNEAPGLNEQDVKPSVGIVTALPHEYAAVKVLLESQLPIFVSGRGAGRKYLYGEVPAATGGRHQIVLALLPDTGNNHASTRAALLLEHFPSVHTVIMSGIAGGIPNPTKPAEHVRLGDIVVSNREGVIQYDFGKEELEDGKVEFTPRHPPRPPSASLVETARLLQADELAGERPWDQFISIGVERLSAARPPAETDVLVSSADPEEVITHPLDPRRVKDLPRVFLGPIASSNTLLKNPIKRDQLRDRFGVKAVEMEGSGIADAAWNVEIQYLVIRGVCDYCDRNKGDAWQLYAAVVAAAYARALLEATPTANLSEKQHPHARREPQPLIPEVSAADIQGEMRSGFADLRAVLDKLSAENSQFDEVRQKLESRVASEYERRFKAARSLFEQGFVKQAKAASEAILEDLLQDADAHDPALRARACTNIAVCAWHLDNVGEVIKWFEEAYNYTPDDPKCIANLATAQMYRGETRLALETAERALAANPDNADAIRTKANILLKEERYDDLSSFLEGKGQRDLRMFFSAVHFGAQQRHEEAAQVLRELLLSDPTNVTYLERVAADILMGVRRQIEREHRLPWQITDGMRKAVEEAESHLTRELELLGSTEAKQKRIGAYINRSAARLMLGRSKEALEDCKEIVRLDPENASAYLNKSKAEMELDDYAAAAESLERYAQLGGDISAQARDLLYAYYTTGQSEKAISFIKKEFSRELREDDLSALSLAVLILDVSQDYESAAELVRRAQEGFPHHSATFTIRARYEQDTGGDNVEDLLKRAVESATPEREQLATLDLAKYYYSQGRYNEALPLFEKLISDLEFTSANYHYLLCLYYTGKFSDVITYATKMRGINRIDPQISPVEALAHKTLGRLREAADIFLALYQRESANTDYLVEYGICLYRLGEKEAALSAFDQARNRVSDTKDLLALARGYGSVGQYVTAVRLAYDALQQSPNDPRTHRIYITLVLNMNKGDGLELGEKYAKAFQESIAAFNTRFPEEGDIKLVDVSEGFSDFFELLDNNAATTETIMDLYLKGALPVSVVAVLKNVKLYDIWLGLQAYGEGGVRVKLGNAEEEEREIVAVAKSKEVVVDLLALLTLERTGQLGLLRKVFDQVVVHQSVFDEIQATIQDESRTVERGGRLSLIKVGDQYAKSEIPPEIIRRGVESLERLREFVKNECEVAGFERELSESDAEMLEAVGLATGTSALLTEQRGLPLLSDDGLLRYRLHIERGIEGFSTYALFARAAKEHLIAPVRLYDLILRLLRMNYRFIPADASYLLYAAERDGYRGGGDFEIALAMLGTGETNTGSLAGVTAEFLANMWGKPLPTLLKVLVLKRVLKAVTQNHPPEELVDKMLDHLQRMMRKAQPLYLNLLDEIRGWANTAYPGQDLTLKKMTNA